jgi:hypothetical protein
VKKTWVAIAKAEFQVTTSRFRKNRKLVIVALFLIGTVWAIVIAPWIMKNLFDLLGTEVNQVLQAAYPGIMRSVVLILWTMVLVYPISYSLQEVKIGQWEIMLSNNVSTREMLFGMFLGKLPQYTLLVLIMAPILISPFMSFYQVSMLGQSIAYLVVAAFVLFTLLLSTVLSTAIQAKLGDSPRGNDIAKAMGIVVVIVFLIPLYALLYFAEDFARLLGLNVFLILPSTWPADLITWITIYFNGVGLAPGVINVFETILGLSFEWTLLFTGFYFLVVLGIGVVTPDRIFSLEAGARTETVTTVGRENIILRGIRRVAPGSRGVLIVTTLKDFGRKAQNTSKLIYAIFISILLPLMINYGGSFGALDPDQVLVFISFFVSLILGMIGGLTFGGVGFLESKDQLWTIKSAPNGVSKFLTSRVINGFLLAIPIVIAPVVILTLVLSLSIADSAILLVDSYVIFCCTIMVGIGITAANPAYEDTKSSTFQVNTVATLICGVFAILIGFILEITSGLWLNNVLLGIVVSVLPIAIVGPLVLLAGEIKLSRSEAS